MPTIGSVELLVVILVAFLVVGPRDLPRLMRTVGTWVRRVRLMANEFQHNLDAVVKEADLEDLKKDVVAIRKEATDIKHSISAPFEPVPLKETKKPSEDDTGNAPDNKAAGEGAKE
jgi:sec-independent protein translocase protein TatB